MFSESRVKVSASLNVGRLAVGAFDLENAPCLLLGSSLSFNLGCRNEVVGSTINEKKLRLVNGLYNKCDRRKNSSKN